MYNRNIIEKEFFIINSENLDLIDTKLYGYVISENSIYTEENFSNKIQLTGNGAYVNVINNSDTISISQDNLGSYGLYIYKNDDYFLISNSFLKLIEFIKEKQVLSINDSYSKIFLTSNFVMSFDETLINEISLIPKDYRITINKNTKNISFDKGNIKRKYIELNSEKGLNILDNWFNKWIQIIRKILKQNKKFHININDQFTSIILLSLILNSNCNFKNITINNKSNNISENIKQIFDNNNLVYNEVENKQKVINLESSINTSYYTKLGITNHFALDNYSDDTNIVLEASFDDKFNNKSLNELINIYVNDSNSYSEEYGQITEKYLWNNLHKLQKHTKNYDVYSSKFLDDANEYMLTGKIMGKNNVEHFLYNNICLNPLNDSDLQKLTLTNENLDFTEILCWTIISRYSPKIFSNFDDVIDNEIKEYVLNLNKKYTFKEINYEFIDYGNLNVDNIKLSIDYEEYDDLINKIVFSNSFKHTFFKYFPRDLYDKIVNNYFDQNEKNVDELNSLITIVKILSDVEYSKYNNICSELDWLKTFLSQNYFMDSDTPQNYLLNKYNTARIDIKNRGSPSNQIKILDISDNNSKIFSPSWFVNKDGVGICISSHKSKLSLKFKCVKDGQLTIDLRTLDIRDRYNKRFPIYIDYFSFKIDNKEVLNENKLIWHDKPFNFSKKVYDGELVDIEIKWKPFNKLSSYE